jgi:glucose/arabinose dehydrogenase
MRKLGLGVILVFGAASAALVVAQSKKPLVFADYSTDKPGTAYKITVGDLPKPNEKESVRNQPRLAPRPEGAMPQAPAGYSVSHYASVLINPRLIRTAPNGDLFVAESQPGQIKVLRSVAGAERAEISDVFASGLKRPFGIAFYPLGANPRWVYVGNTDSIVRFPYKNGDLKASGAPETIVAKLPSGGNLPGGGHWTRDIAFSRDGKKMFVSVGSFTNVNDPDTDPAEKDRATILEFNPDGTGGRVYVSGIRNAVGLAVHPRTGDLWASVNERDGLGDDLVPDYITRVKDGDFFGWPWFYMGGAWDPRHEGKHPELKDKVRTPDVLVQPHSASLEMVFYTGNQFPSEHRDSAFAALHGSWNRKLRTGYKVIRVPLKNGLSVDGGYEDFLTGFVTADGQVWGRPVGVAIGRDGALFVSDDGTNSIWRVSYTK